MDDWAYRVCFVCTGNICRSPMAEAVFRARLVDAGLDALVESSSAGTGGWHAGDPADRRTLAVLRAAGLELAHRARQFEPGWFDRYDLVLALDTGHARELRALAPTERAARKVRLLRSYAPGAAGVAGGGSRHHASDGQLEVPDPYYGGPEGFEECLRLVEDAMPGLLAAVSDALGERAAL